MSGFSVHASSSAPMSENLPPMVSKSVAFNSKCWAGEGLRRVRGSLGGGRGGGLGLRVKGGIKATAIPSQATGRKSQALPSSLETPRCNP